MNENPMVSVIIPVYNTEKYLPACIESVLTQTYTNLELFLVDDGSKDGSLEICKKYAQSDPRVIVMTKENGGQGSARNMALDKVSGAYIVFVDSDDCIKDTMLEDMVGQMRSQDAQLAVCGYEQRFQTQTREHRGYGETRVLDNSELMREYVATAQIRTMLCNKIYQAELFESLRFPEIRAHEDAYILHELLGKCRRAVHMDACYYIQNVRSDSTEQKPFSENNLVLLECARRLMDYYSAHYPQYYPYVAYKEVNDTAALMHRILLTRVYGKYRKLYKRLEKQLRNAYHTICGQYSDVEYAIPLAREAVQHPVRFKILNVLRGWKRKLIH